jgi:hypothetical protein
VSAYKKAQSSHTPHTQCHITAKSETNFRFLSLQKTDQNSEIGEEHDEHSSKSSSHSSPENTITESIKKHSTN